jgi:hypothetical protein
MPPRAPQYARSWVAAYDGHAGVEGESRVCACDAGDSAATGAGYLTTFLRAGHAGVMTMTDASETTDFAVIVYR